MSSGCPGRGPVWVELPAAEANDTLLEGGDAWISAPAVDLL